MFKMVFILFLVVWAYSNMIITSTSAESEPFIVFQTEFFPSSVHRVSNSSTLRYSGWISRVKLFKDRMLEYTYDSGEVELTVPSAYSFNGYNADIEMKIIHYNQDGDVLQIVILITKSMLQQPKSIVGILNLDDEVFEINLNEVKGINRQFRGIWYQFQKKIVIIKPEILIISEDQFERVKEHAGYNNNKMQDDLIKGVKWSRVKNRAFKLAEL